MCMANEVINVCIYNIPQACWAKLLDAVKDGWWTRDILWRINGYSLGWENLYLGDGLMPERKWWKVSLFWTFGLIQLNQMPNRKPTDGRMEANLSQRFESVKAYTHEVEAGFAEYIRYDFAHDFVEWVAEYSSQTLFRWGW